MKFVQRPLVLVLALVAVAGVLVLRGAVQDGEEPATTEAPQPLPRLVEFGADKCIPCKAMKPVLAELGAAHAGALVVETVDVWKDREAGTRAGIESIPTQVFYAADGRELYRHAGFISRADIEAKFAELGVDITPRR